MIEIIQGRVPDDDLNAIQVHTYPSPKAPGICIATITHDYQSGQKKVTFCTIVDKKAMSHEEAMVIAREYAEENDIPRIYELRS